MTHDPLHEQDSSTRPLQSRRWHTRSAGLAALLAAFLSLSLMTASPASALGYPISYTITNATNQTLVFELARGGGLTCLPGSGGVPLCVDRNSDFSAQVSPRVVNPGGSFTLSSELDILSFRQANTIIVSYQIGASGNDRVILHTDPQKAECQIRGTKAYTCERRPGNAGRDFTLQPAA